MSSHKYCRQIFGTTCKSSSSMLSCRGCLTRSLSSCQANLSKYYYITSESFPIPFYFINGSFSRVQHSHCEPDSFNTRHLECRALEPGSQHRTALGLIRVLQWEVHWLQRAYQYCLLQLVDLLVHWVHWFQSCIMKLRVIELGKG